MFTVETSVFPHERWGGQPQVFPEASSGQYGYSNLMLLLL